MRKTGKLLWAVGLLAGLGALSLVSCARKESASSGAPSEFENAYSLYVTYVEESGGTPVSYEEWLATIKGEQGEKGEQGDKGDKGEQGDKGDAGVGVKSAYWTDEGELVLVLTDGTELNVGKIQPPAHTCTYGEWEDVIATCESHWQVRICNECGDSQMRSAELLAHSYVNGTCEYCHASVTDLYNDTYGYEYLGTMENGVALQAFYKDIKKAVVAFHTDEEATAEDNAVAELEYASLGLTMNEAVAVWKTFKNDNPLYYWLSNTLSYTVETATLLVEEEYASGSVRAAKNEALYGKIEEYLELVKGETSAYRIALAYHDAIIENIDYAYDDSGKPSDEPWAHSIVGVLDEKGGVCESYARTFQILLNASGVENVYVTGVANGEAHVWNMVQLEDGKWYYCDLAWDDTPSWMWGVSYNYFCVAETQDVNWSDGGWVNSTGYFADKHTAHTETGEGVDFLYALPKAAENKFTDNNLLELRETFSVEGNTYAVTGYNTVQLTATERTGALTVPETVDHDGKTYTVISVGGISDEKFSLFHAINYRETTSVFLPKTIRFIWDGALRGVKLESIVVDENNPYFTSVDGVLFTKSLYTLIAYPVANPRTEYAIPDETVEVAYLAMDYTDLNLEKLTIGVNVKHFGMCNDGHGYKDAPPTGWFGGNEIVGRIHKICQNLQGKKELIVAEGNGYFCIDGNAVYNANKTVIYHIFDNEELTAFEIPATVMYADDRRGVFRDLAYLEAFTVEEGNQYFSAENGILYNADKTKIECVPKAIKGEVSIAEGVKELEDHAFSSCKNIIKVVIPESVKEISVGAFSSCVALTEVILHDEVTAIGSFAFHNCLMLKTVVISGSVTEMGSSVFYGCKSLTIYCESESQPSGWDKDWNITDCPVVWGYTSD